MQRFSYGGPSALAAGFPNDRMALVSSTRDQVLSSYFGLTGPQYEAALTQLKSGALASGGWKHYLVAGTAHGLLAQPSTALRGWLSQMVTDDAAWVSTEP